jgi:hypothetical protein
MIFAYDEAQNLSDRAENNQYPLSLLLDIYSVNTEKRHVLYVDFNRATYIVSQAR